MLSTSLRASGSPTQAPHHLPGKGPHRYLGPKPAVTCPEGLLAFIMSLQGAETCATRLSDSASSRCGTSEPGSATSPQRAAASQPSVLTHQEGPALDPSYLPQHLHRVRFAAQRPLKVPSTPPPRGPWEEIWPSAAQSLQLGLKGGSRGPSKHGLPSHRADSHHQPVSAASSWPRCLLLFLLAP